jgi:hypothetical protein
MKRNIKFMKSEQLAVRLSSIPALGRSWSSIQNCSFYPAKLSMRRKCFRQLTSSVSPWMARSWTPQEAALAENLLFRLKDCSISLGEVSPREVCLHTMRRLDYDAPNSLPPTSRTARLPAKFADIWNGLKLSAFPSLVTATDLRQN